MNWPYLETEPFRLRYVLAAHWLQYCAEVVEIGGYKTPISNFLHGPRITVLDPLVMPFDIGHVKHLPILFQDWQGWPELHYGVLVLGLELHLNPEGWERFYRLIDGSKVTVLEIALNHIHSVNQFDEICRRVAKKVVLSVVLDFSENDFSAVGGTPKNSRRKLVKLQ